MNPFSGQNPGRLDRRVTLIAPELTKDAAGGYVQTWLNVADVWADWNPATGREIQQAAQSVGLATGTMRIRWRQGVGSDWRVVMGSTTFEVTAPPVEVGRRVYLDLVVRAITTQAAAQPAVNARLLHDYSTRLLHDGSLALLESAA